MTSIEMDADELALHQYQQQHFYEISRFIVRQTIRYGTLAGIVLSQIFYLWTFRDPPRIDVALLLLINYPPPTWTEVVLNYIARTLIGAVVGCLIATGLGYVHGKLVQLTCHKQVSLDYVERYDLSLVLAVYQVLLPIPTVFLILVIETPVLWYNHTARVLWFAAISYVVTFAVLTEVARRFLKWYIPPLLPALHE